MALLAGIVFCLAAVRVLIADGPKIPIIFILLWVGCFFAIPYLGLSKYLFMSVEVIITVILLLIGQYKSS